MTKNTRDANAEALPYLLFTVGKNTYGINCEYVISIETLGRITTIIESGPTVRGGVVYQDRFIPLTDMRKLFGLDSQIEEFEVDVKPIQRIKDHEEWMSALERSVMEHTDFTLTDDPHQCALGKWLYSFHTDNNVLRHQLKEIETPHKALHDTAKAIKKLMRDNQYGLAAAEIEQIKATHYKTTLSLLSSLQKTVADNLKELYIVIADRDEIKGIVVDSIVGVEYLQDTLQTSESTQYPRYVECLRQRRNDERIIIVLKHSLLNEA